MLIPTVSAIAATPNAAPARPVEMRMVLERTIFHARVMTVDALIDGESGDRIRELAQGHSYSDELAAKISQAALSSKKASIRLRFLRHVDFDRFVSEVRDSVHCAWESRVISEAAYRRVEQNLPVWFAAIQKREIQEDDRLTYAIDGDRLHTTLTSRDGAKLVDHIDEGSDPRLSVLGSYFARCSDFREPLIRSLFPKR